MKKTLIAMLIAVVSTSLFAADYLAYDYKASIKRLDLVVTYKKNNPIMQNYKVANDTIKGVVLIPICANCLDGLGGVDSSLEYAEGEPQAWFVRVGDKLSEKYLIPFIAYDDEPFVAVAKFGAYTLGKDPKPQNRKNNKYAWMKLGYALGDNEGVVPINAIQKKFSGEDVDYRFLGASNSDAGYVINTGFGTVKPTSETVTEFDPCEGVVRDDTYYCDMVISITGTLCGGPTVDAMDELDPLYSGACDTTPMWDLCNEDTDHLAVICGTWTLKYNAKLTAAYVLLEEEAIYAYFGKTIDETDVYFARLGGSDIDDEDDDPTVE